MGVKGVLLDNIGRCSIFIIVIAYIFLYGILVIVGSSGPSPILYSANSAGDPKQSCGDPNNCVVWWTGVLTDMTPQHQLLWVNMELERPIEKVTQRPALAGIPFRFSVLFNLDVVGVQKDGTETAIVTNSSHSVDIVCPAGALNCDTALIFTETMIKYPTYRVICRFLNPYAAFASAPIDSNVRMHFSMGYISQAYTQFEIGVKMFFVVCGSSIFLMYTALLFCGPGVKDDDGNRLSSTYEQRYIWWLGLFAIFFNNPFLILEIENPSIILAGFNAFCVITFLTSLLTYWLVQFDLARLQGENGFDFHLDPSFTNLGLCFWLPKILFAAIFWTISLAAYMWQRIMQINDPAYSLTESFPLVAEWFGTFITGIVVTYLLYFFALFVLTVRHWRTIRPTNKLVIGLTLFTLILSAVGIFLQAFTAVRTESILILAAYSAPNLYVWFLQFAFIPGPRLSPWVQQVLQQDQGNSPNYRYPATHLQMERIVTDTSGVMGRRNNTNNGGDEGNDYDDDVQPEDVNIVVDTNQNGKQGQQGYGNGNGVPSNRNPPPRRVPSQQYHQPPQQQPSVTRGSPRQVQRSQYPPQPSRPSTKDVRPAPNADNQRPVHPHPVVPRSSQVPPVAVVDVEDYDDEYEDDGQQDDRYYADDNQHDYDHKTNSQSFAVGKENDSENDEQGAEETTRQQHPQQYRNNAEFIPESTTLPTVPSTAAVTLGKQPRNSKNSNPHTNKPSGPRPSAKGNANGRRNAQTENSDGHIGRPGNPFADATGKTK